LERLGKSNRQDFQSFDTPSKGDLVIKKKITVGASDNIKFFVEFHQRIIAKSAQIFVHLSLSGSTLLGFRLKSLARHPVYFYSHTMVKKISIKCSKPSSSMDSHQSFR